MSVACSLFFTGERRGRQPESERESSLGHWSWVLHRKNCFQGFVNFASDAEINQGDCTGNTPAIDSINFPGLCLEGTTVNTKVRTFFNADDHSTLSP